MIKYNRRTICDFMLRSAAFLVFQLLATLLEFGPESEAALAQVPKVILTTSSLTEREGLLHVAQDYGFFRNHGVAVTLVQIHNGPLAVSALITGESQLHWGSATAANLGAISAGADLVFVAGFINRLTGTVISRPTIKTPAELRGKILGVNTLSGGGSLFTLLALDHWGLEVERDKIQFRSLGGDQAVIAQALAAGTIDAAYFGYTFGKMMQAKGFHLLADLQKLPVAYQGSGIVSRRAFVVSSPTSVEAVLSGLVDSVDFIRKPANKMLVLQSLAKGTRLRRVEDAEDGYQNLLSLYERKIYPSAEGIQNVIRLVGSNNEKVRRLRAEELIVDNIVRKMEKEGRFQ